MLYDRLIRWKNIERNKKEQDTSSILLFSILAVGDRMLLGEDFNFAQISSQFFPNLIKFATILPKSNQF